MPYFMDSWLTSKLDYLLARYGIESCGEATTIRFNDGAILSQLEILTRDDDVEIVLTQSILCSQSNIALRLTQCVTPESLFGVVGIAFFLDNRLYLATVLPTDLAAEEWITVYEHQKTLLLTFLGK